MEILNKSLKLMIQYNNNTAESLLLLVTQILYLLIRK